MTVRHGYSRSSAYYESWAVGHTPTHNPRRTPMAFLEELDVPLWMRDGLCAQTDPEIFFPDKGGSTREAKRTCLACDVRTDCLAYALEHGERWGIWGGLSERQRRKLNRVGGDT